MRNHVVLNFVSKCAFIKVKIIKLYNKKFSDRIVLIDRTRNVVEKLYRQAYVKWNKMRGESCS